MNHIVHSTGGYNAPNPYQHFIDQNHQNHQNHQAQGRYPVLIPPPSQHNLYPQLNHPSNYPNLTVPHNYPINAYQPHHFNQNAQRGHHQAHGNEHQVHIIARLKKIEDEIENAKYTCHALWLYFLLSISVLSLAIETYYYIKGWYLVPFVICFLSSFWTFVHAVLGIRALHKGSLEDAIKAVWFMKGYIVPLVSFIVNFIVQRAKLDYSSYDTRQNNQWAEGVLINIGLFCSIGGLLLHILVFLSGARKFRDLLMKREKLRKEALILA